MTPNALQVAELVRPYLKRSPFGDITFEVVAEKVRHVDGWWRVPVQPSRWPDRVFPVYEVLAEIEEALRDDQHFDILLSLGEPVNTDKAQVVAA